MYDTGQKIEETIPTKFTLNQTRLKEERYYIVLGSLSAEILAVFRLNSTIFEFCFLRIIGRTIAPW